MIKQLCEYLGVPVRAAEDAMGSERLARQVLMGRRALLGGGLGLLAGVTYGLPIRRELGTLVLWGVRGERLDYPVDLGSSEIGDVESHSGWSLGASLLDSRGKDLLVNRFCRCCLVTTLVTTDWTPTQGQRVLGYKMRLMTEDGLPWSLA